MARTGLVVFNQEYPDYYMCKSCRTHIALAEDFISIDADTELIGATFDKAVNLRVDGPVHHREVAGKTVVDIYCVNCDDKLGWRYIHVNGEEIALEDDNVRLRMKKLVRKYSNQILDAETMSPVREDP
ncbi:protein yippee-like At4g27740 [Sesamum indicum]|uniref:Protein yippee-like n=1 Tax=Sesamum indicum TaxID=4182 RepID=A0A6I9U832_SESIN|nr:protein yippee-like At4g27740 [Sesamum indicum]